MKNHLHNQYPTAKPLIYKQGANLAPKTLLIIQFPRLEGRHAGMCYRGKLQNQLLLQHTVPGRCVHNFI